MPPKKPEIPSYSRKPKDRLLLQQDWIGKPKYSKGATRQRDSWIVRRTKRYVRVLIISAIIFVLLLIWREMGL